MEKVILISVHLPQTKSSEVEESLDELERLVESAGGVCVERLIQNRKSYAPGTLVGKGFIKMISDRAKREGWKTIVFDHDLMPAQQRNIEKEIRAKIIDRTRLILDIFAQRAHSREGQMQVELAQLTYMLPRLTERYTTFEQQVGGIGTRGPGERKLEYDRRRIRERITRLNHEINRLRQHRELARLDRARHELPQISIIGYTNAGKSTLLNALISTLTPHSKNGHQIYSDDRFFATLDPTTRRIPLTDGRAALFTDTVGFIQKLPTSFIASFRATLEEENRADLLLHVVDGNHPLHEKQEQTVKNILYELGAENVPCMTIYAKCDLLLPEDIRRLQRTGAHVISSHLHTGISELIENVSSLLKKDLLEVNFNLPIQQSRFLSFIYSAGQILSKKETSDGLDLKMRMSQANWGKIQKLLKDQPNKIGEKS